MYTQMETVMAWMLAVMDGVLSCYLFITLGWIPAILYWIIRAVSTFVLIVTWITYHQDEVVQRVNKAFNHYI